MAEKVVIFTAPGCVQCSRLKADLGREPLPVDVQYMDVNTPVGMANAQAYGVKALPFCVLLNNGKEVTRLYGNKKWSRKLLIDEFRLDGWA